MSRADVKVTYFSDIIGRFDKQAGKIYGVSVITEGKAKGHDLVVDSQTLMEIKQAAEQSPDGRLKTKLNHRSGVEAVFGYLENFRVDGPKLLADLKMLKSHKDFEQTFEQIEALPNAIGLSVAFVGKECTGHDGKKLARCREILSADLVPEPAANPTGMFEAKNAAVVDTEILSNMKPAQTVEGAAPGSEGGAEPTLADVMNFLQEQILPRIEATEQFQQAIQAELDEAAAGGEENPDGLKPGDDGNAHSAGAAAAGTAAGGTNGGSPSSPTGPAVTAVSGAPAGAPGAATGATGAPQTVTGAAVPAEMAALQTAVVQLQRQFADKENQERETQLERAMEVIKTKTEAVTEYARGLEQERDVLLEALRTGAQPVRNHAAEIVLDTGNPTDFQSRVAKHVTAGKTKTEAVMLARKEDPNAHMTWLQAQGVVTTL